jgi:hypothetical protein
MLNLSCRCHELTGGLCSYCIEHRRTDPAEALHAVTLTVSIPIEQALSTLRREMVDLLLEFAEGEPDSVRDRLVEVAAGFAEGA